jgi:hypothetical protein
MMIDYEALATSYLEVWNEPDEAIRAKSAAELYAADAGYIDPLVVAEGVDTIVATIGAVQQQFPGWTFRLAGPVDGHHNQVRFTWTLGPAGTDSANAPVIGFDVAVLDAEGKVSAVYGFLDRVPAAA